MAHGPRPPVRMEGVASAHNPQHRPQQLRCHHGHRPSCHSPTGGRASALGASGGGWLWPAEISPGAQPAGGASLCGQREATPTDGKARRLRRAGGQQRPPCDRTGAPRQESEAWGSLVTLHGSRSGAPVASPWARSETPGAATSDGTQMTKSATPRGRAHGQGNAETGRLSCCGQIKTALAAVFKEIIASFTFLTRS